MTQKIWQILTGLNKREIVFLLKNIPYGASLYATEKCLDFGFKFDLFVAITAKHGRNLQK
jgi:hypothetical protein